MKTNDLTNEMDEMDENQFTQNNTWVKELKGCKMTKKESLSFTKINMDVGRSIFSFTIQFYVSKSEIDLRLISCNRDSIMSPRKGMNVTV